MFSMTSCEVLSPRCGHYHCVMCHCRGHCPSLLPCDRQARVDIIRFPDEHTLRDSSLCTECGVECLWQEMGWEWSCQRRLTSHAGCQVAYLGRSKWRCRTFFSREIIGIYLHINPEKCRPYIISHISISIQYLWENLSIFAVKDKFGKSLRLSVRKFCIFMSKNQLDITFSHTLFLFPWNYGSFFIEHFK